MRRFLLSTAIIAGFLTAFADDEIYKDYFSVLRNNQEITDGADIICTDFHDNTQSELGNLGYSYDLTLMIMNKQTFGSQTFEGVLSWDLYPTQEEYVEKKGDIFPGTECFTWGIPQLCGYGTSCFPDGEGCISEGPTTSKGGQADGGYLLHLNDAPATLVSSYRLTITSENDPDAVWSARLVFAPTEEAAAQFLNLHSGSVSLPGAGEVAPSEYYDLAGRRVMNPGKGIFIVKRGSRFTKEKL